MIRFVFQKLTPVPVQGPHRAKEAELVFGLGAQKA